MAKKREVVQVDENKLKSMIAGDIPISLPKEQESVTDEIDTSQAISKDTEFEPDTVEVKPAKRKKIKIGYEEIFLSNQKINNRRQTTLQLGDYVFRRIQTLLKTTDDISMAIFINNVLVHHLEEYDDTIEDLVRQYAEKLINK